MIDVYITSPLSATPKSITFTGKNQTQTVIATEKGTTAWTATSSKPSVATVAQDSKANKFNITSVSTGKANVTIADSVGNSFVVAVTVP